MSIDFVLDFSCDAKDAVHTHGIVTRVASGVATDDPLARGCDGCPARVVAAPFACVQSITYPIEEATERFLLERLPVELTSTAGRLLRRVLTQLDYDGASAREARDEGVFDAREPFAVAWGDEGDAARLTVTTDQLLEMMFFVGTIQPTHALLLSLFFGEVPHDVDAAAFEAAMEDPTRVAALFRPAAGAELTRRATGQRAELLRFLEALRLSATLRAPLLVEP